MEEQVGWLTSSFIIIHLLTATCQGLCPSVRVARLNVTSDHDEKVVAGRDETQDVTPLCRPDAVELNGISLPVSLFPFFFFVLA